MFEIVSLARNRHRSADHYRAMQEYIAAGAIRELESRGIDLAQCDVLELGAGTGGYSAVLKPRARSFLAADLNTSPFFEEQGIPFASFSAMDRFPLDSRSFDLIYCSSLIEHVPDPSILLSECRRVLRPQGRLYLSFPPFYSLAMIGGHGLQPFHFLGETMAVRLTNRWRGRNIESYATLFGNWGLFPLTIGRVARYLTDGGFDILDTYTRLSPINTAKLPGLLKDLMTWHVCYLAQPRP